MEINKIPVLEFQLNFHNQSDMITQNLNRRSQTPKNPSLARYVRSRKGEWGFTELKIDEIVS